VANTLNLSRNGAGGFIAVKTANSNDLGANLQPARVFVRFNLVASFIVNENRSAM
jgi:hypothetical protein